MTILPSGAGRPFIGGTAQVKVEPGAADFSVFEQQVPPGTPPVPLHVHDSYDEAFYMLDGEMSFAVGGTPGIARAGAFVFVPRGEAHRFWNASPAAARMLVIGSSRAQHPVKLREGAAQVRQVVPSCRVVG